MADDVRIEIGADTAKLQRELREAQRAAERFAKSLGVVGREADDVGDEAEGASSDIKKLTRAQQDAAKAGGVLSSSITKLAAQFSLIDMAISTAVDGIKRLSRVAVVDTTRAFAGMQDSVAKTVALFGGGFGDIERVMRDVQGAVSETGRSSRDLSSAMFDIVSAGIPAAKALDVLRASGRLATAGFAETRQVADALTSILNAYQLEASEAARVTDILFQTQKLGKTTISELSETLGTVIPLAATANVSLEDLGGAIATLTAGGLSTGQAITGIRASLVSILEPSKESVAAAEKLGVNWNLAGVRAEGYAGLLQSLSKAIDGAGLSADEADVLVANLTGRVEGTTAVMSLARVQTENFQRNLDDMGKAAGATATALELMRETTSQAFRELADQAQISLQSVGADIAKFATPAAQAFTAQLKLANDELARMGERDGSGGARGLGGQVVGTGAGFVARGSASAISSAAQLADNWVRDQLTIMGAVFDAVLRPWIAGVRFGDVGPGSSSLAGGERAPGARSVASQTAAAIVSTPLVAGTRQRDPKALAKAARETASLQRRQDALNDAAREAAKLAKEAAKKESKAAEDRIQARWKAYQDEIAFRRDRQQADARVRRASALKIAAAEEAAAERRIKQAAFEQEGSLRRAGQQREAMANRRAALARTQAGLTSGSQFLQGLQTTQAQGVAASVGSTGGLLSDMHMATMTQDVVTQDVGKLRRGIDAVADTFQEFGDVALRVVDELTGGFEGLGGQITAMIASLATGDVAGFVINGVRAIKGLFVENDLGAGEWADNVGGQLTNVIQDAISQGLTGPQTRAAMDQFIRQMVAGRIQAQLVDQIVGPALEELGTFVRIALGPDADGARRSVPDVLDDPEFKRRIDDVNRQADVAASIAGGVQRATTGTASPAEVAAALRGGLLPAGIGQQQAAFELGRNPALLGQAQILARGGTLEDVRKQAQQVGGVQVSTISGAAAQIWETGWTNVVTALHEIRDVLLGDGFERAAFAGAGGGGGGGWTVQGDVIIQVDQVAEAGDIDALLSERFQTMQEDATKAVGGKRRRR